MNYKDQTFCHHPCKKHNCFRHRDRIYKDEDAIKFLQENTWMPICFFVEPPKDCKEYEPE